MKPARIKIQGLLSPGEVHGISGVYGPVEIDAIAVRNGWAMHRRHKVGGGFADDGMFTVSHVASGMACAMWCSERKARVALAALSRSLPDWDVKRAPRLSGKWLTWCREAQTGNVTKPPTTAPQYRRKPAKKKRGSK